MSDESRSLDDAQEEQRQLLDRALAHPGIAAVLDVYGRVSPYTSVVSYTHPAQIRNALGGNA